MESQAKKKAWLPAWLQLIRFPNLFTVPGDVLAGCAVAAAGYTIDPGRLLAAIIASLCLYAAGLVMNDLVDAEEDRRERANRPIASGAVSKEAGRRAIAMLLGLGLAMLGMQSIELLATGVFIGAAMFVYNMLAKRTRLAGSLTMGVCRAGNLMLGVVAVSPGALLSNEVYLAAGLWFAFVASFSWLAFRETHPDSYGKERMIPAILCVVGGTLEIYLSGYHDIENVFRAGFCFFFAMILCYQGGLGLATRPRMRTRSGKVRSQGTERIYPKSIGLMISALIPMQAGVQIVHADGPLLLLAALLTLFCWPINRFLARYIQAS